MTKLFTPLRACLTSLLALGAVASLTGCELYFGEDDGYSGDDRWSYCDVDGYYTCEGNYCQWQSADCPAEPGWSCEVDADCAAGCYCGDDGVCEEAGYCNADNQCPSGFTCDEERASCVPDQCSSDADCDAGSYCDAETNSCTESCFCETDAEAQGNGWANCDEDRGTCNPVPEAGSCQGASTCATAEPSCPAGSVPLVSDGCYTGQCGEIASCDLTPECEKIQAGADCSARANECTSVYVGLNCTSPNGEACDQPSATCQCETFQFSDCRTASSGKVSPFTYEGANGELVNMFSIAI